jgi:hypothetical protein
MDHPIEYISYAETSTIEDYIYDDNSTANTITIVYYTRNTRNQMYELEHCMNHEYINDDPITVQQGDNIMRFLEEIS